ncbi:MAG: hypothetical protein QOJ25_2758 [Solirubrobacteraceae bacterium]|jgi:hypothetical protein|nr:hypothetical protein [Solirubrobacteraceae bacterium]
MIRLARLVLGLYPLAFRRRYGQEMRTLLEQSPVRASTLIDLLRGAVVAHLRPTGAAARLVGPADRVRASASGVLGCWVVFAAAGFGFYKTTEDQSFSAAGYAHPLLGDVHGTVQGLAALGSVAVLLGALPLIRTALKAARDEPRLRRWVSVPFVAVLVFAVLTGALVVAAHAGPSHRPATIGGIAFLAWGLAGLVCGAACVVAARKVLFAVRVPRWQLITASAGAALATGAMVAMTLATALYAGALPIDAGHLAGTPNGPFQSLSASASVVVQAIVMAVAATLAATATLRGWRAAAELRAADAPGL